MPTVLLASVFAAVVFMLPTSVTAQESSQWQAYKELQKQVANGKPAPDFSYPDIHGNTQSLSSLKGQVVYIDLWATWCGPCVAETPYFETLKKEYAEKDVAFVSISMDSDSAKWARWVHDKNMTGYQLLAGGKHAKPVFYYTLVDGRTFDPPVDGFGTHIPVFVLIDKDGTIVDNHALRPSEEGIRQQLDALLKDE